MVANVHLINDIESHRAIAESVARGLVYARVQGDTVTIQTPISFPSGRMVGVRLLGGPTIFTVTDDGAAMRDAELMGADDIWRREARKIATEYGLKFNEWELFEAEAPLDRLVGYTALVANAAAKTMLRTAEKFAERFEDRRREELAIRLERVFGKSKVEKDSMVAGASTKSWKFDARVALPSGRQGLFSVVTPSPASVVFAYSKMDDVSRLDDTPFIAAVLDGKFAPDDKALLKRAARRVFEISDADETFLQAA